MFNWESNRTLLSYTSHSTCLHRFGVSDSSKSRCGEATRQCTRSWTSLPVASLPNILWRVVYVCAMCHCALAVGALHFRSRTASALHPQSTRQTQQNTVNTLINLGTHERGWP